jgi:hypothetical protein
VAYILVVFFLMQLQENQEPGALFLPHSFDLNLRMMVLSDCTSPTVTAQPESVHLTCSTYSRGLMGKLHILEVDLSN